jgi:hypothetical protein
MVRPVAPFGGGQAEPISFLIRSALASPIMVTADIGDDRLIHLVAADAHRARINDAAEGEHSHLGRATTDIDDHRARGLLDRQTRADRGGHGLLDEEHAPGAGELRGFLNGAPLHRGRARRHADHDLRAHKGPPIMHLADEMLDHFLGDLEIGDDAVSHRADRLDIAGGATEHHLGRVADGFDDLLAVAYLERDDGGLVQDDPPAFDIDEGVGGAEIDRHVGRNHAEETAECHRCRGPNREETDFVLFRGLCP